jgi:uncharacterized protein (TIGR00255 family)
MIKSMTAFASVDRSGDDLAATIEIRTYNSRHLDIFLRIAPGYTLLEEKIKGLITEKLARGRVEVKVQIKDSSGDESAAFEIDEAKARSYYNALKEMQSLLGIKGEIPFELLITRGDLIQPKEKTYDMDTTWNFLEGCMLEALEALDVMRQREGAYIAGDFMDRLNFIKDCIEAIEKQSLDIPALYQARLKERIAVITAGGVALDAGRIEQEAAILADRSDISEEITRARSHLEQFKVIMGAAAPAGQKLNFLLQEINREFNTIGSKAGKTEISHAVVDVKSELEKLREQVQNVE